MRHWIKGGCTHHGAAVDLLDDPKLTVAIGSLDGNDVSVGGDRIPMQGIFGQYATDELDANGAVMRLPRADD